MENSLPQLVGGKSKFSTIYLLIGINCAVFLVMVFSGISWISPSSVELLRWGANYGPHTLGGQPWRLLTSAFLHIGIVHLALNMWCLARLGRLVERLFGPFMTVAVYGITGVGASLLSLSWNPMRISAGASGAIFGLAGTLIPVLYYGKLDIPKDEVHRLLAYVVKFAFINLIYGLKSNIDNMGHLGGLVTGLITGLFLAHTFAAPPEERLHKQRFIALAATVALPLVFIPVAKAKSYARELYLGQIAIDRFDYKAAGEHFEKYVAAKPNDAWGHGALAEAYYWQNRETDAAREYEQALKLDPDTPWIELNLANIYFGQGKTEAALALYRKSITDPNANADAQDYRSYGDALSTAKDYPEAETILKKSIAMNEKDSLTHELLAEVEQHLGKSAETQSERKRVAELQQSK